MSKKDKPKKLRTPCAENTQFLLRVGFGLTFLAFLAVYSLVIRTEKIVALEQEKCNWDYFFEKLEGQNKWFREDKKRVDMLQMSNSVGMDLTFYMFIYQFLCVGKIETISSTFAHALYGYLKMNIQVNLQELGRIEGFLYGDPGIPALTVPYHDTNDFYYSGHICMATIYLIYFYSMGWKLAFYLQVFQFCYNWYLMTVLYTHYVIDYTSGIAVGFVMMRVCEHLSFVVDKWVMGLP